MISDYKLSLMTVQPGLQGGISGQSQCIIRDESGGSVRTNCQSQGKLSLLFLDFSQTSHVVGVWKSSPSSSGFHCRCGQAAELATSEPTRRHSPLKKRQPPASSIIANTGPSAVQEAGHHQTSMLTSFFYPLYIFSWRKKCILT